MSVVSTVSKTIINNTEHVVQSRFASAKGEITRALNKIAINSSRNFADEMKYTFSKATPSDLERLTSKSIKDSYKRVTWTNPKDNKVYHILEEGRDKGKIQVRILDKDGAFVKNAELEPKTIVVFDNFFSPRGITHGELMETFVKRFNPFANVERLEHKKGLYENIRYRGELPQKLEEKRFKELLEQMENGKKVDYISVSEVNLINLSKFEGKSGEAQQKYISYSPYLRSIRPIFEKILNKGTRILEASGNDANSAKSLVSDRLAIEGVEGVGALRKGKIAFDSCSRNSVFTQHYEKRDYFPQLVKDKNGKILGLNVTGLSGVDLPLNWKTKKIREHIGGTSYATPIRTAKLALNDMMEGIL